MSRRLPVWLSPRPVAAMLDRFGRFCEALVFTVSFAAKAAFVLALVVAAGHVPAP